AVDANNCANIDSVEVYVKETPAATAAVAVPASICVSGNVNLSLTPVPATAIDIQWQKDTGSGFVNISGANSVTYSEPVTATTTYQATFSCNNTVVATSSPVTVTYSNPSILS